MRRGSSRIRPQPGSASAAASGPQPATSAHEQPRERSLFALTVGALGVVYGDIGTSPLYAMRESFHPEHGVAATPGAVLGVLSLVLWSLIAVISVKYLAFVLRADNHGQGGILALVALAVPRAHEARGGSAALALVGVFGAALLYGDGMLTPAISVLSAVEGLRIAAPALSALVVPTTIAILVALFWLQRRGTGRVGALFGPVMMIWFAVIAALGAVGIAREPQVLAAVAPWHGARFLAESGFQGFVVLAAVFLVVTGGEALYADIGHFGRRPIRFGWFGFALPALLLNYFGQGALLLGDPSASASPFFELAPGWALVPLVALATLATVIASQAMISGAFSLTRQAVQLGFCPRVPVSHTSAQLSGQVFVAPVNWMLMLAACALVVGFGSSSNLAAAYGMSVSADMVLTTLLLCAVAHARWGWRRAAFGLAALLLPIDLAFFGSNLLKITHGGWFSLAIGGLVFLVMTTWQRGRRVLLERMEETALPLDLFLPDLETAKLPRVPRTAVFLTRDPEGTPLALLHNIRHNKVVHAQTVFFTLVTEDIPYVRASDRVAVKSLGDGFFRVLARYGFMELPDVPALLSQIQSPELEIDRAQTSYFVGRETLIATGGSGMGRWREHFFAFLSQNALPAISYFRIPPNQVVELGVQIEL